MVREIRGKELTNRSTITTILAVISELVLVGTYEKVKTGGSVVFLRIATDDTS
jgi:hypothetical protein